MSTARNSWILFTNSKPSTWIFIFYCTRAKCVFLWCLLTWAAKGNKKINCCCLLNAESLLELRKKVTYVVTVDVDLVNVAVFGESYLTRLFKVGKESYWSFQTFRISNKHFMICRILLGLSAVQWNLKQLDKSVYVSGFVVVRHRNCGRL